MTATRSCLLLLILTVTSSALQGATISVSTLSDDGPGSLRQAITLASAGMKISITATGTISLTSGELLVTNDVTISGPGAEQLAISANNSSRIFQITSNARVAISDVTRSGTRDRIYTITVECADDSGNKPIALIGVAVTK